MAYFSLSLYENLCDLIIGEPRSNALCKPYEKAFMIQYFWNQRKLKIQNSTGIKPLLYIKEERRAKAQINNQEFTKFRKEYNMAKFFAEKGFHVILLNEKPGIPGPDALIDGIKVDFKALSSSNNILRHAKNAIFKQRAKEVWFEFSTKNASIIQGISLLSKQGIHGKFYFKGESTLYSY